MFRRRQSVRVRSCSLGLCGSLAMTLLYSEAAPSKGPTIEPSILFRIAAQEKEKARGKRHDVIRIFDLQCVRQDCSLKLISFSPCTTIGLGSLARTVDAQFMTTRDGSLKVARSPSAVHVTIPDDERPISL